jgi:hypothetical protein
MSRKSDHTLLWIVGGVLVFGLLFGDTETVARRKLTKGELVKLAREAGFPDADFAATIALRESGGDPMAELDTRGRTDLPKGTQPEHSIGLWQINLLAHPEYTAEELTNPRKNAEAALIISKHGTDWTPWTTAHEHASAPPSTSDDGDFEP